eukprot:GDKJ01028198.1.p1 GENE.GDKJ01028198.1~~GDKJ01028198.1.p1  ORF type:complete len:696 (+),score=138.70 GDKJ01028198.1:47-2089(+)
MSIKRIGNPLLSAFLKGRLHVKNSNSTNHSSNRLPSHAPINNSLIKFSLDGISASTSFSLSLECPTLILSKSLSKTAQQLTKMDEKNDSTTFNETVDLYKQTIQILLTLMSDVKTIIPESFCHTILAHHIYPEPTGQELCDLSVPFLLKSLVENFSSFKMSSLHILMQTAVVLDSMLDKSKTIPIFMKNPQLLERIVLEIARVFVIEGGVLSSVNGSVEDFDKVVFKSASTSESNTKLTSNFFLCKYPDQIVSFLSIVNRYPALGVSADKAAVAERRSVESMVWERLIGVPKELLIPVKQKVKEDVEVSLVGAVEVGGLERKKQRKQKEQFMKKEREENVLRVALEPSRRNPRAALAVFYERLVDELQEIVLSKNQCLTDEQVINLLSAVASTPFNLYTTTAHRICQILSVITPQPDLELMAAMTVFKAVGPKSVLCHEWMKKSSERLGGPAEGLLIKDGSTNGVDENIHVLVEMLSLYHACDVHEERILKFVKKNLIQIFDASQRSEGWRLVDDFADENGKVLYERLLIDALFCVEYYIAVRDKIATSTARQCGFDDVFTFEAVLRNELGENQDNIHQQVSKTAHPQYLIDCSEKALLSEKLKAACRTVGRALMQFDGKYRKAIDLVGRELFIEDGKAVLLPSIENESKIADSTTADDNHSINQLIFTHTHQRLGWTLI